jgi:hypothetical protein
MSNFFSQITRPFWMALGSCAEMVASNVSGTMKFDALVSRAVHTLNRFHFDQNTPGRSPSIRPTVVRSPAEYFQSQAVGTKRHVSASKEQK